MLGGHSAGVFFERRPLASIWGMGKLDHGMYHLRDNTPLYVVWREQSNNVYGTEYTITE